MPAEPKRRRSREAHRRLEKIAGGRELRHLDYAPAAPAEVRAVARAAGSARMGAGAGGGWVHRPARPAKGATRPTAIAAALSMPSPLGDDSDSVAKPMRSEKDAANDVARCARIRAPRLLLGCHWRRSDEGGYPLITPPGAARPTRRRQQRALRGRLLDQDTPQRRQARLPPRLTGRRCIIRLDPARSVYSCATYMYDYYVTYPGILYESTVHVPIYIDLCKIHVRYTYVPAIDRSRSSVEQTVSTRPPTSPIKVVSGEAARGV